MPRSRQHFELVDPRQAEARVAAAWERVAAADLGASYFTSWPVLRVWTESTRTPVTAVLGWQDGQVALVCLLAAVRFVRHGIFRGHALRLNALGDELFVEHNDVLVHPDANGPPLVSGLVRLLTGPDGPAFDELELPGMRPGSRLVQTLASAEAAGTDLLEVCAAPAPYVDLAALRASPSGYLGSLPARARQKVRRAERWYRARGDLVLDAPTTVREALAVFDDLVVLHQARRPAGSAFTRPETLDLHRALIADGVPRGAVQMLRLRCGGAVVGCLYNTVHRGHVCVYQTGFRYGPDNEQRPGVVTHHQAIHHNLRLGHTRYDLLAGNEPYKRHLCDASVTMSWYRLRRPHLRVRVEDELRRLKRLLTRPLRLK